MTFINPGVVASVVTVAMDTKRFVAIARRKSPFENLLGFPGMHVRCGIDTLQIAACSALLCKLGISVNAEQLILIDARSNIDRDPRGHIIDIGYLLILPHELPVSSQLPDMEPKWFTEQELLNAKFAFDHNLLFSTARQYFFTSIGD